MYIYGLKGYICSELNLLDPKIIEDVRHVTKLIEQENKFNKSPFIEEDEIWHQDSDKKVVNKCRYCCDKWPSRHICNNKKLYA